jgi:rhodanese-related sulfurtransferase
MKNAQVVVLTAAILLTAALVIGAAPRSVASAPVVQHRVLGFLSYLPADYQGISVADLRARVDAGTAPFLLDVRETEEFATGAVRGAINIPIRSVPARLDQLPASKSAEIITICPSGFRSAMVTMTLTVLGYTNVKTMTLGMREWNARGYPVVKSP